MVNVISAYQVDTCNSFFRLSKAKMECTEDNSERLKVCVDEYVRGQMNCTLPWQEGDILDQCQM